MIKIASGVQTNSRFLQLEKVSDGFTLNLGLRLALSPVDIPRHSTFPIQECRQTQKTQHRTDFPWKKIRPISLSNTAL